MTPDEYRSAEPHHLAVVVWWRPAPDRKPYATVHRATFWMGRTAWDDHPWSEDMPLGAGADFVDQWALEAGPSMDHLHGSGRTAEGWGELGKFFAEGRWAFADRVDALECSLSTVEERIELKRRELQRSIDDAEWIRSAIHGERVGAP